MSQRLRARNSIKRSAFGKALQVGVILGEAGNPENLQPLRRQHSAKVTGWIPGCAEDDGREVARFALLLRALAS